MTFRGDIEGLRGIAILLVVLAHAGVPGFGGGFVGVDIFFVISGYLISGQLLTELEARGKIDYWAFYERRVRRLMPALLVMLVATAVAATVLLPSLALIDQLVAARWAALWFSNVYFIVADYGYFDPGAGENLFLHTWSLGVEEQFYLIWPLLIACAWKRGLRSWKYLAGVAVLGFLLCLLVGGWNAMAAYYSMPTRLWQLAIGSLAFVLAQKRLPLPRALPLTGACLVLAALYFIGEDSAYPGAIALLPTFGAALLVLGGSSVRLLELPPLRFLGRVSYGWYLWHWPVLAMLPAMGLGTSSPLQRASLALASLLLGWGSTVFIEEPLRRRRSTRPRTAVLAAILGLLIVMAGLTFLVGSVQSAQPGLAARREFEQKVWAQVSVPEIYGVPGCDQWFNSSDVVPCRVGPRLHGSMVLLADSAGAHWLPALKSAAEKNGLQLIVITKSSCVIADFPFVYQRIKRRYVECERWRAGAVEEIVRMRPDVVVIGSSGSYQLNERQWEESTVSVLRPLASSAKTVLVLAPTPILPFSGPNCVIARGHDEDGGRLSAPDCVVALDRVERKDVERALAAATARVPGARFVNLNDLLCLNGTCSSVVDGKLAFRDTQHLNAAYVESLSEVVAQRLEPVLVPVRTPQRATATPTPRRIPD